MRVECFISYSHEDDEIADQLVSLLESEGIEPWWDKKISPTTRDFSRDIEDAIKNCQCFLVIWTQSSVKSEWVRSERQFVKDMKDGDYKDDKVVSIAINKPSIPLPFNTNQLLNISLTENRTLKKEDKEKILEGVKSRIGIVGRNEHVIHPRTLGEAWEYGDLAIEGPVPGTNILSSFRPCGKNGTFLIMRFNTTEGWVHSNIPSALQRHKVYSEKSNSKYRDGENEYLKIRNDVYFIKDPIRPYSIQIGGIRSEKPNAKPGTIEAKMTRGELNLLPTHLPWLSLTLAEILTNEDSLQELSERVDLYRNTWEMNEFIKVKEAIARNPFSPLEIQKDSCRFCDDNFKQKRCLHSNSGATLIANDFPFGPSFHYVAILNEPIHSWEHIKYHHLHDLNQLTQSYLSIKRNRFDAAGMEYGFNSTVRHLVLGRKTHSSAGASIRHIHKQIWGMAPHTTNLADQLITVSDAYFNINIDYQKCYIDALRDADYVVWEDKNAVLYIPYGQISTHELQIMMHRPFGTYIDFTDQEIKSLSVAEFMVFRIYKELGITSFNSIFLFKLFNEKRAPTFRVVQTFVTREVDLAVSELSTLYVVDQHPNESKRQIKEVFSNIVKSEEMDEIIRKHANFNGKIEEVTELLSKSWYRPSS